MLPRHRPVSQAYMHNNALARVSVRRQVGPAVPVLELLVRVAQRDEGFDVRLVATLPPERDGDDDTALRNRGILVAVVELHAERAVPVVQCDLAWVFVNAALKACMHPGARAQTATRPVTHQKGRLVNLSHCRT